MPNKHTFLIKPIREVVLRYVQHAKVIVDPFANNCVIGNVRNDLNPEYGTEFCMDALDFLKSLPDEYADVILYDPPYSPRQVSECYKQLGKTVNMSTTQSSYWSNQKKEISRVLKHNGIVITCSWNSGGIGTNNGFSIVEILLVAHGGWHNDTIITVERKTILN